LTIINVETKRTAGKLRTFIENDGLALIRLNEWNNQLRIENANVNIKPQLPDWWIYDEATKLEMKC